VVLSNFAGSEKVRTSPKADSLVCAETVRIASQKINEAELSGYPKRWHREGTLQSDVLSFPGMIINLADDATIATSCDNLLPGNAFFRRFSPASQDSRARAVHHYQWQQTSDMRYLYVVVRL